jgi:hypothetical protein
MKPARRDVLKYAESIKDNCERATAFWNQLSIKVGKAGAVIPPSDELLALIDSIMWDSDKCEDLDLTPAEIQACKDVSQGLYNLLILALAKERM